MLASSIANLITLASSIANSISVMEMLEKRNIEWFLLIGLHVRGRMHFRLADLSLDDKSATQLELGLAESAMPNIERRNGNVSEFGSILAHYQGHSDVRLEDYLH
jgi:hypothetical protein